MRTFVGAIVWGVGLTLGAAFAWYVLIPFIRSW